MKTKHTPGPWSITRTGFPDTYGPGTKKDIGPSVDELVCVTAGNDNGEKDMANAYLIAAAPELLESLQRILEQVVETGTVNAIEGERARATINKAKGGA